MNLIMISQYERIRVLRSSNLLYSAQMRAGSWIYDIHLVSINFWLTCIYYFRGSCFHHSPRTLVGSIFLLTCSPTFHGWSGFYWYLHSTRLINNRIQRLCDTFVISKCVLQFLTICCNSMIFWTRKSVSLYVDQRIWWFYHPKQFHGHHR
jgi:hypothetical protein